MIYEKQSIKKKEICRLFESMYFPLENSARIMGVTRSVLRGCLYSADSVTDGMAQRLSAAFKGYGLVFDENIFTTEIWQSGLQETEKCSQKLLERIQSYFKNLRYIKE